MCIRDSPEPGQIEQTKKKKQKLKSYLIVLKFSFGKIFSICLSGAGKLIWLITIIPNTIMKIAIIIFKIAPKLKILSFLVFFVNCI